MGEDVKLTEDEKKLLAQYLSDVPMPDEKASIFQIIKEIMHTSDTSKVANLNDPELNTIRILKNIAIFNKLLTNQGIYDYLNEESEVILATSDSKDGFLIQKSVQAERKITFKTGQKKSGWFKKKEEEGEEQ